MAQKWYHNKNKKKKPADNYIPPFDAALLAEPIETLGLTADVMEKLKSGKVLTLLDVARRREKDFYRIPTFNKKNLFELKNAVQKKKFRLRPDEEPQAEQTTGSAPDQKERPQRDARPAPDNRERSQKDAKPAPQKKSEAYKQPDRDSKRQDKRPKDLKPQPFDMNVSEKRTKEEREKQRPQKPQVQQVQDMYVKINKNGKWGFADRSGKEVIAPVYDEVFTFKDDMCCVQKEELFGYIDRKGEEVIPVMYDCALSFSEGYACVFKGAFCGYINKLNEVVIDFKFDAGTPVIDGNCRVKKEGKWGELHLDNPYEIRWIN